MADLNELEELRAEFLYQLEEVLQELTILLEKYISREIDDLNEFKGKLHTLKGTALSVQQRLCADICHHLESFLDHESFEEHLSQNQIDQIYSFLDLLPESIDPEGEESTQNSLNELVSNLSNKNHEVKLSAASSNPSIDTSILTQFGMPEKLSILNQNALKLQDKLFIEVFNLSESCKSKVSQTFKKFGIPVISIENIEQHHELVQKGLKSSLLIAVDTDLKTLLDSSLSSDTALLFIGKSATLNDSNHRSFSYVVDNENLEFEMEKFIYRVFRFEKPYPPEPIYIHILLADDNLINLKVAKKTFEKLGLKVDTARDGNEVIEKASSKSYDLAVLDLEMPDCSGLLAAYQLRLSGKQLPIFAYSAHEKQDIKDVVLSSAMDAWINKPVDKEKFKSVLREFYLDQESSST